MTTVSLAPLVSLDEVSDLVKKLKRLGLGLPRLSEILDSENPGNALTEFLNGEPALPIRWSKPTLHEYAYDEEHPDWQLPRLLAADQLTFEDCADCGTHVWVSVGDCELHISKRVSDFIQVSSELQVKPTTKGLLVRRAKPPKNMTDCKYAND